MELKCPIVGGNLRCTELGLLQEAMNNEEKANVKDEKQNHMTWLGYD